MAGTSAGAKKGRGELPEVPKAIQEHLDFVAKAPRVSPAPKLVAMVKHTHGTTPEAIAANAAHNKIRAKLMGQYSKAAKLHTETSNARYNYLQGAPLKYGRR